MNRNSGSLFGAAFFLFIISAAALSAAGTTVFLKEDFSSLDNWMPFTFPKIARHSVYSIERHGEEHVLRAESNASASAIVYREAFNVHEYPRMRWRWKVMNLYSRGNPRTREGDDYPMRIYIMFEFDPKRAGGFERLKYALAKKMYGQYPPHSSISYVWANEPDPEKIITSPYTDRAKMILLEQGAEKANTWQDEEVNVVDDYRQAFGADPPPRARIAVMNDSDNTGEHSVSYLAFIEVFK